MKKYLSITVLSVLCILALVSVAQADRRLFIIPFIIPGGGKCPDGWHKEEGKQCCPDGQYLTSYGGCCPHGTYATGQGGCCPDGTTFVDGKCMGKPRCPDGTWLNANGKCCPNSTPYFADGKCMWHKPPSDYSKDKCYIRYVNHESFIIAPLVATDPGDPSKEMLHWFEVPANDTVWMEVDCGKPLYWLGVNGCCDEEVQGNNVQECSVAKFDKLKQQNPDWVNKCANFSLSTSQYRTIDLKLKKKSE